MKITGSAMSASRKSAMGQSRAKGFTLIELMVVVVIVAVLAAIAIPSYRNSVHKANRTEAKSTLAIGAQMLEKCFTEFGSYTVAAGCPSDSDVNAAGNNASGHYTISSTRTASAFTITAAAAGGQTDDTTCSKFTISSTGAKVSFSTSSGSEVQNSYGTCW